MKIVRLTSFLRETAPRIPRALERARQGLRERLVARPVILWLIVCALLAWTAVQSARIVKPRVIGPFAGSASDFDDYLNAAERLLRGEDPYRLDQIENAARAVSETGVGGANIWELLTGMRGVGSYLYPPFTAFSLGPLAGLEYPAAAAIYQAIAWLALVGFLWMSHRLVRGPDASARRTAALFAAAVGMLLVLRFLLDNASNGNIGFLIIFLTGAGLYAGFQTGRLAEFGGGFLIGVAAGVKVTPGFLGFAFVAGRRWLAIAGCAAGLAFALAIPATLIGWQENLALFETWNAFILKTYSETVFVRSWANNQSIAGALGKLFVPHSDPLQFSYGLPLFFQNRNPTAEEFALLRSIARATNAALYCGLAILSVATALKFARRRRLRLARGETPWTPLEELRQPSMSAFLMAILLVSLAGAGVSWYHAYSALLVPVVFRLGAIFDGTHPLEAADRPWIFVLGFFGCLFSLLPEALRDGLSIYSVFAWCAAGLAIERGRRALRVESA